MQRLEAPERGLAGQLEAEELEPEPIQRRRELRGRVAMLALVEQQIAHLAHREDVALHQQRIVAIAGRRRGEDLLPATPYVLARGRVAAGADQLVRLDHAAARELAVEADLHRSAVAQQR